MARKIKFPTEISSESSVSYIIGTSHGRGYGVFATTPLKGRHHDNIEITLYNVTSEKLAILVDFFRTTTELGSRAFTFHNPATDRDEEVLFNGPPAITHERASTFNRFLVSISLRINSYGEDATPIELPTEEDTSIEPPTETEDISIEEDTETPSEDEEETEIPTGDTEIPSEDTEPTGDTETEDTETPSDDTSGTEEN